MNDLMRDQQKLADGAEKAFASLGIELEPFVAEEFNDAPAQPTRRSRWKIPAALLIATLISMTWAGIAAWSPVTLLGEAFENHSLFEVRRHVLANWVPGLLFSISLTIILGAHELGHYFATKLYRIQSSLPIFIPFPISPAGTCGAVILMDGLKADRRQIFDIGLAGPLAGLFFAFPIAAIGLMYGTPPQTRGNSIQFGQPIAIQWLAKALPNNLAPDERAGQDAKPILKNNSINNESMNPMLMAAWVGFLVTGLNMVPISQLDGGHVIFGLLGRRSRLASWLVYLGCIGYVMYTSYAFGQPEFVIMLLLIPLMGIAHPPSSNDDVSLGLGRQVLGVLSLAIPFLCIPFRPVVML
jgi:membrane-associated protease RseP (regulator of RpoE activity)